MCRNIENSPGDVTFQIRGNLFNWLIEFETNKILGKREGIPYSVKYY